MQPTKDEVLDLLPVFQGNSVVLSHEQTVHDIIKAIKQCHKKFASHYDKIVLLFFDNDISTVCDNLYWFCKENIPYNEEPETEQTVKPPAGMLSGTLKNDCKSYALFCGGILGAMQRQGFPVNWCYRFASYRLTDKEPHHVFIVVNPNKDEIWIDPVPGAEKKEPVWILDKKINDMALISYISGIGNNGSTIDASELDRLPVGSYWANGTWHFPVNEGRIGASTLDQLLNVGESSASTAASVIPGGSAVVNTGISLITSIANLFKGSSSTAYQKVWTMFPLPANATADQVLQVLQAAHAHFDPQLPPPTGDGTLTGDWPSAINQLYAKYSGLYTQLSGGVVPSNSVLPTTSSGYGSSIMNFITGNPGVSVAVAAAVVLLIMNMNKKGHQTAGIGSTKNIWPVLIGAVVLYFLLSKKKPVTTLTTVPVTSPVTTSPIVTALTTLQNLFSTGTQTAPPKDYLLATAPATEIDVTPAQPLITPIDMSPYLETSTNDTLESLINA